MRALGPHLDDYLHGSVEPRQIGSGARLADRYRVGHGLHIHTLGPHGDLIERRVTRAVDLTNPAGAESIGDFIRNQSGFLWKGHVRSRARTGSCTPPYRAQCLRWFASRLRPPP